MRDINIDITISQEQRIDSAADEFEACFRKGGNPRIEDVVARHSENRSMVFRELLLVELQLRIELGQSPNKEEYLARFPAEAQQIVAIFEQMDETRLTQSIDNASPLDQLAKEPKAVRRIPNRLGRFELVKELGEGTYGVVYLAFDTDLNRQVAIKVLRQQSTGGGVGNYRDEARSSASLTHASIINVFETGQEDDFEYIVQPYMEGGNLQTWMEQTRPAVVDIVKVIAQVADGLAYLHSKGITHCDLKLENVLMTGEQTPVIADFGLAIHHYAADRYKYSRFGTPDFMSPEQVLGKGDELDGRADIWSLGVMLYYLLTGHKPFFASDRDSLYKKIVSIPPKPPAQWNRRIPKEISEICMRCLAKDRQQRYHSADEVKEQLNKWLNTIGDASRRRNNSRVALLASMFGLLAMLSTYQFIAPPDFWSNEPAGNIYEVPSQPAGQASSDAEPAFHENISPDVAERINGATESSIRRIAATSSVKEIREMAEQYKDDPKELLARAKAFINQ